MTSSDQRPVPELRMPRRIFGAGAALAVVALILITFGYCASHLTPGSFFGKADTTTVTHDLVIQQVRAVAKLVSSEATVRDVIVYENTWYGSTKRSLVVVTGRLLAGIDLRDNPDVTSDHQKKRMLSCPPTAQPIGGARTGKPT